MKHQFADPDNEQVIHIPVLGKSLTDNIALPQDGVMVDATIGHGGHSFLFGKNLDNNAVIAGFDVDPNSISAAKSTLESLKCKVLFVNDNFSHLREGLDSLGINKVDFLLADLGVCSAQLVDPELGLAFKQDMPLDMRIDKRLKTTAADIVNETDEKTLADLIYEFGQDRASRRIARFIVCQRKLQRIITTGQLASIVSWALKRGSTKRRIHPATRTFQALRIAVNGELDNLSCLLEQAPEVLNPGGYIAIISFHSLEDRIVKLNFKSNKKCEIYEIVTKKPITPERQEIEDNPRSRSSKLRIARKL